MWSRPKFWRSASPEGPDPKSVDLVHTAPAETTRYLVPVDAPRRCEVGTLHEHDECFAWHVEIYHSARHPHGEVDGLGAHWEMWALGEAMTPLEDIRLSSEVSLVWVGSNLSDARTLRQTWPVERDYGPRPCTNDDITRTDVRADDYWDRRPPGG